MTATNTASQKESPSLAGSIATTRKAVISGDWTEINNGNCTLSDLGLRHNGSGLVWLRSGVSVWDADCDTATASTIDTDDGDCLRILTLSPAWREYWHRNDGKALTTFAVQVLTNERQEAFDGWVIYRHPQQADKYTIMHEKRDKHLIHEYTKRGWKSESTHALSLRVKSNIEFGRLMMRLGYIQIRTRQITGRKETFWLYRSMVKKLSSGKKSLCPQEPTPHKACSVVVQTMTKPHPWFKHIALDGKWQYVYADHIRFLTKKRHRVDGVRVQGYTAKGVPVEVLA
ncbi:MAG: hypothetical protein ACTH5S_08950 [Hafnia alvei]|uniref:hypothetical protein n=1 Tax=Hafnia TaxID=568 RepID=UPI00266CD23E|nr:hypothetical protein [Hafnia paralvei]